MVTRSWRRLGMWRGNIKTHCSPLSVKRSATPLQLFCSKLPISRVLFGGCTRGINNWELPSSSMALPRGKCEGAEDSIARKRIGGQYFSVGGKTNSFFELKIGAA